MTAKKKAPHVWIRWVEGFEHDPKKAYPPYYRIVLGIDSGNVRLMKRSGRLFSKETALAKLARTKEFDVPASAILRIRKQISSTRLLPANKTRADQLTELKGGQEGAYEYLFEHVLGLIPGEKGSGRARIAVCHGECGHPGCAKYPMHAALWVRGIANPGAMAFSAASAEYLFEVMFNAGLLDKKDLKAERKTLATLGLPAEETRSDRLINSGHGDYLEILHGVRPPDAGSPKAELRMCPQHGHLHVRGIKGIDIKVKSVETAIVWIKRLYDQGLYTAEDVATVNGQIAKSGLAPTHPDDDVDSEPGGSALKDMLLSVMGLVPDDAEKGPPFTGADPDRLPN